MTRSLLALLLSTVALGCWSSVTTTTDAVADATLDGAPDADDDVSSDLLDRAPPRDLEDAREVGADAPRDTADTPRDTADARDADDAAASDAGADASLPCALDPPSGPPADTHRSCAAGEAPAWHCREVGHCGGRYVMGSTDAWHVDGTLSTVAFIGARMRTCDLHYATVRPGYTDAYEVTVARFRTWMRAGMPRPRHNQLIFSSLRWGLNYSDMSLVPPTVANTDDRVPGHPVRSSMCTYTPEPGPNDDLPINCVTMASAIAFCWWDGMHLATEAAWEFLARNRGTTATPFGAVPTDAEACRYGDVGGYTGLCPLRALPQRVDAFPLGATRDPAGVFGLYGGVSEYVLGRSYPHVQPDFPCRNEYSAPEMEGDLGAPAMVHGTAWYQNLGSHRGFSHASSRGQGVYRDGTILQPARDVVLSPAQGFRCMRWVPEVREE